MIKLNRTVLVGRLTRDPELKITTNGVSVATFTVAVNRPFKNANGENEVDFINCVTWRKQAENLVNYMKKGNQVGVDGRIQTRSYDNKEGKRVFVTEVLAENIQFLESRNNDNKPKQNNNYQQQPQKTMQSEGQQVNINDSDLPF